MPRDGEAYNPHRLFKGIFIPDPIALDASLSPSARLCFGVLTRFAGRNGECFPSMEAIGEKLGVEERQARRYVEELQEHGLIQTRRQQHSPTHIIFLWSEAFDDPSYFLEIQEHGSPTVISDRSESSTVIDRSSTVTNSIPNGHVSGRPPHTPPKGEESQLRESLEENARATPAAREQPALEHPPAPLGGKNVIKAIEERCSQAGTSVRFDAPLKQVVRRAEERAREAEALFDAWRLALAIAIANAARDGRPATDGIRHEAFGLLKVGKMAPTRTCEPRRVEPTGFRAVLETTARAAGCLVANGVPDWLWQELEAGYLADANGFLKRFNEKAAQAGAQKLAFESVLRAMLAEEKALSKTRKKRDYVDLDE